MSIVGAVVRLKVLATAYGHDEGATLGREVLSPAGPIGSIPVSPTFYFAQGDALDGDRWLCGRCDRCLARDMRGTGRGLSRLATSYVWACPTCGALNDPRTELGAVVRGS